MGKNVFLLLVLSCILILASCGLDKPGEQSKQMVPLENPSMPEWAANAVLYQVNTRQFSEEGSLNAVTNALPRIKELGVDIIWLMPVYSIGEKKRKGKLGSPYSVKDYYSINPEFGTMADFKNLVDAAHTIGLRVILDWVPNHTAWDAVWIDEHPEYYTEYKGALTVPLNEHGEPIEDWSDVVDLDYSNPDTRKAMIDAMKFWVEEYGIDGYRMDMAGLVPNDFWKEARPAMDSLKPLYFLAEWQDEPEHFTSLFHTNYGWKWKDITKSIGRGEQSALALDSLHDFLTRFYPSHFSQLYFTQNHDENTHSGTDSELYGESADAFKVLSFTWSGFPMIYNGQEDSLDQRLGFFEQTPIEWGDYNKTPFYQALSALRHGNRALWSGPHGGIPIKLDTDSNETIYAFYREKEGDKVVVILNLSTDIRTFTLNVPESLTGPYADVFGRSTTQLTPELTMTLKPWEYIVLSNK